MLHRIPTGPELCEKVAPDVELTGYRKTGRFHNPAKHAKDGKHYNWTDADSGILPENTVNTILQYDSVIDGIAAVYEQALTEFLTFLDDDADPVTESEKLGLLEEICIRFGRGACAERLVENHFIQDTDRTVVDPLPGDEDNKVDIRCINHLSQVKLSGKVADKASDCGYRTDWSKPRKTARLDNEEREVIWVTVTGKIFKEVDSEERLRGMDRWERIN